MNVISMEDYNATIQNILKRGLLHEIDLLIIRNEYLQTKLKPNPFKPNFFLLIFELTKSLDINLNYSIS